MICLLAFLIYLVIQVNQVTTDGSPTNIRISLKLNIKKRINDPKICTTASCNKTARELLKSVDLEADPCKDFYQFSCGTFLKTEMPPGKKIIGSFEKVTDDVNRDLKDILEGDISGIKLNFAKQTKMSFQSCMNTERIESRGIDPLKNILKQLGGWPLIQGNDWKEEDCNLTAIITKLQTYMMLGIFQIIIVPFRIPIAIILPPELTFPDDSYNETSIEWSSYKRFITNASLYIGEIETSDSFIKDVDDIIDFEASLAKCRLAPPTSQELLNETTLEVFENMLGKIFDTVSFFKSIYKIAGLDLDSTERIGIYQDSYLKCLGKVLETTTKRKVVNYLMWYVIRQLSEAMPKQFTEFEVAFQSEIGKSRTNISRLEKCVEIVNDRIHDAVGYLYVIRYFSQTTKYKVLKLIQRLKSAFRSIIASQKWLSQESRDAMTQKLDRMTDRIGYPDYLNDPRFLERHFDGVEFSGQSFVEIFLTLNTLKLKESLRELRIPVDSDLMSMPIAYVNAMYQEYPNKITFPAAILVPPFYDNSYLMNLNFGGIGSIIGHEITHGFDNIKKQLSLNGSIVDIWQGDDIEKFTKRAVCIINQFNELVEPQTKTKVNGNFTNAENIADIGGLRIAYLAYKDWLREHGEEKQLPGFPYNSEQMFFIAYGMKFCRKLNNETALQLIKMDSHAPNQYRINMSLKNFKSFSKAFKCKADSEMNLSDRCKVW